jgi:hypothetical protein
MYMIAGYSKLLNNASIIKGNLIKDEEDAKSNFFNV